MSEFRRTDVLLNKDTGEKFSENDMVKITTKPSFSKEIIGRIEWIATLELMLDKSEDYKSITEKIKYEDIYKIEKLNEC